MMKKLRLRQFVAPDAFFHFGRGIVGASDPVYLHCHDFHEICWIEDGAGWHHINGKRRPLRSGMLLLVRDRDGHGFSAAAGSVVRLVNVAFSRSHWDILWRRYYRRERNPMHGPVAKRERLLAAGELRELDRRAMRLPSDVKSAAELDSFLLDVMMRWADARHGGRVAAPAPDWLLDACRRIADPAKLSGGVSAFYRLAGRSADHVARVCRQYLQLSPTDIVNGARLDRAAVRLAESDDTILDVAHECGLPNIAHFYKLFGQRFGTTPRKYRMQSRLITRGA
jgi:AraC family transcriptional regulator, dual regulator of chb operon